MNESDARALRDENNQLKKRVEELERFISQPKVGDAVEVTRRSSRQPDPADRERPVRRDREDAPSSVGTLIDLDNADSIYAMVKKRLLIDADKDPVLLRVLAQKAELEVEVERIVVKADGNTLRGRLARLIADGLFRTGMTGPGAQKELSRRGSDPGPGNITRELKELALMGFLTVEEGKDERSRARMEFHEVPGAKINIIER